VTAQATCRGVLAAAYRDAAEDRAVRRDGNGGGGGGGLGRARRGAAARLPGSFATRRASAARAPGIRRRGGAESARVAEPGLGSAGKKNVCVTRVTAASRVHGAALGRVISKRTGVGNRGAAFPPAEGSVPPPSGLD
jgi:hypothetical protein